jgi:hypothetical protein
MEDTDNEKQLSLPINSEDSVAGVSINDAAHGVVLSKDGFKLFPQPVLGDSLDPLNWSFIQKHIILAIVMFL